MTLGYVAGCVLVAGKLKEFKAYLEGEGAGRQDIKALREEVEALANSFPMPGL
jgi:glycine hydroxymethyltransferase